METGYKNTLRNKEHPKVPQPAHILEGGMMPKYGQRKHSGKITRRAIGCRHKKETTLKK